VLFKPGNAARPDLFGQPVDDLDARQIALVHGAVGVWPTNFSGARCRRVAVENGQLVFETRAPARPPWSPASGRSWSDSHLLPSIVSMKCRSDHLRPARRCNRPAPCRYSRIFRAGRGDGDGQVGRRLVRMQGGK
jgi:hypothetical protein